MRRAGDGRPNPMPPQPLPNPLTAIRVIASDALGPSAWASAPQAVDRSFVHAGLKRCALVLLPRLEHKGHWFAMPFGTDIQLGREATRTPSERFRFWVPFFAPAAC